MSWLKRVSDLLRHPPVQDGKAPVPAPTPEEPPVEGAPAAAPATGTPVVARPAKASSRPVAPLLAAQAAAAKAAAEAVRREQAAASARQILSSIGVHVPQPARPAAPAQLLSPERKALITEAMRHWSHGHQIYERLDPGLKDRVRAIAERMAPK